MEEINYKQYMKTCKKLYLDLAPYLTKEHPKCVVSVLIKLILDTCEGQDDYNKCLKNVISVLENEKKPEK